jgi:hypothetical protein
MKLLRSLLVVAGLALTATPAHADDPYVLTLKGVNGQNSYGVYTGAYYGKLTQGGSTIADNFTMFCIDFTHDVSIGSSWGVTQGSLLDPNAELGAKNYIGYSGATMMDFKKAAWLASQFNPLNPGDFAGIHGAIWNTFLPANGQADLGWAGIQAWIDKANLAAANNFYGMDFSGWSLLTPTGTYGQVQLRFTATPEPATMILMGSGLIGMFFVTAYKRRLG